MYQNKVNSSLVFTCNRKMGYCLNGYQQHTVRGNKAINCLLICTDIQHYSVAQSSCDSGLSSLIGVCTEEVMPPNLPPRLVQIVWILFGQRIQPKCRGLLFVLKQIILNDAANDTIPFCRVFYRCRNIFAIQQNLTNITMSREADLDRARQYYELLYSNPDVSTKSPSVSASSISQSHINLKRLANFSLVTVGRTERAAESRVYKR